MSDVTIAAAVEAAVSSDDQLRAQVGSFVKRAIGEAEALLVTGSPAVKAQLVRSVVPAMVKAMTVDDSPDEHAELRDRFDDLMAELRSGVADPGARAVSEGPPTDEPPAKPKRTRKKAA